ncbi:hypothetical protein ACHMW6_17860 [Pseudoduganella sp. UC29_106]|uniref:hypothetical protein n=1 Tax=Pseudoduganella sp. UC29_106 TaxID=3374553 RepID=UPI003756DE5E
MNIKRSVWAVPVAAIVLFGLALVMMVYSNSSTVTGAKYAVVTRINAITQDVDTLGERFMDPRSEGRSVEALAVQAKQVHEQLRALGALPEHAALATRLAREFEAWYRPAMQARLARALEDDPEFSQAIDRHYSVLQNDLREVRLFALRRFAESALEDNGRAKRMLSLTVGAAVLLIATFGLMAWIAVRASKRPATAGRAAAMTRGVAFVSRNAD